jgi:hypothetical protein
MATADQPKTLWRKRAKPLDFFLGFSAGGAGGVGGAPEAGFALAFPESQTIPGKSGSLHAGFGLAAGAVPVGVGVDETEEAGMPTFSEVSPL